MGRVRAWIARGLSALALVAAAKPPAAAHAGRACFGGVPETAASGVFSAGNLTVIGQSLYATGGGLQRVNLRTGQVSSVAEVFHRGVNEIGPIDAREAYATTGQNDIIAYDFASQKTRTVVSGHLGAASPYPTNDPPFALDARYFYYSQLGQPLFRRQDTGIFRIRRDGSGQREALGAPPYPGGHGGVIIEGGFFYYRGGSRDTGATIVRRRVEAGSPEQKLVALQHPSSLLMRIFDGRLYYVDDRALWSVPVRGSAPPTRLVAIAERDPTDVLFEPGCLYWADGRKIRRVELGRAGAQPEIVADETTYQEDQFVNAERWRPGTLASDGRYLYWPDTGGERIMRARRDPRPPPPRPELVAAWVGGTARPPAPVNTVIIGDGWGCGRFREDNVTRWQCWSAALAGGAPPASIAAHDVPWLTSDDLFAGPDRLCASVQDSVKCWPWPDIAHQRPADLPQMDARARRVPVHIGGTFTCTNPEGVWSCSGDDRFGQLGDGTKNVAPFGGIGAVGTWHGCASTGYGETFCWGRGDAFQLGFPTPDTCVVGAARVACSRSARAVAFALPPVSQLYAGDLFSCAASHPKGLVCWGASRDGLFGTEAACPAALHNAWPTRAGSVAAPRATCASKPVPVPAFATPADWFGVGPRGMCGIVDGRVRCAGAIPTPAGDVRAPAVSRGDQPSACGIAGRDAVCWGAGYSPPANPGAVVAVQLDRPPVIRAAVLDVPAQPGTPWEASCKIHFGCDQSTPALPVCPRDAAAEPWAGLLGKAPSLVGTKVRARGPLALGWIPRVPGFRGVPSHSGALIGQRCGPGQCCNQTPRPIVIGGAEDALGLATFQCAGDDSRVCCNAPALGQPVIASGTLEREGRSGWRLASPELCALSTDR